jgi:hypothetical protein
MRKLKIGIVCVIAALALAAGGSVAFADECQETEIEIEVVRPMDLLPTALWQT